MIAIVTDTSVVFIYLFAFRACLHNCIHYSVSCATFCFLSFLYSTGVLHDKAVIVSHLFVPPTFYIYNHRDAIFDGKQEFSLFLPLQAVVDNG